MTGSKSDAENQLKKLLGRVGYALIKPQLRGVKIKIDTERKTVRIIKDQVTHSITFDEIEQVFNE